MNIIELLKKDLRLITGMQRSSLAAILLVFFIAFLLSPLLSGTSAESYFYSYPLFFLLILSFLFIQDMWAEENKEKAINALLSAGVDIRSIWITKPIASFTFSYGALLVCGLIFIVFEGCPSASAISSGLLVQPCLCLLLLLQVSAIFLFVKSNSYAALLIISIIPFVILYHLWAQDVERILMLFVVLLVVVFFEFLGLGKIAPEKVRR